MIQLSSYSNLLSEYGFWCNFLVILISLVNVVFASRSQFGFSLSMHILYNSSIQSLEHCSCHGLVMLPKQGKNVIRLWYAILQTRREEKRIDRSRVQWYVKLPYVECLRYTHITFLYMKKLSTHSNGLYMHMHTYHILRHTHMHMHTCIHRHIHMHLCKEAYILHASLHLLRLCMCTLQLVTIFSCVTKGSNVYCYFCLSQETYIFCIAFNIL